MKETHLYAKTAKQSISKHKVKTCEADEDCGETHGTKWYILVFLYERSFKTKVGRHHVLHSSHVF